MSATAKNDSIIRDAARALEDPGLFLRAFLGEDPWKAQDEIAWSVAHNPQTAVKAAHSTGKTHIAAGLMLWWLARWPDEGIVITTAPTWLQVEQVLWGTVRTLLKKSIWPFPEPQEKTRLQIGSSNYALGLSTNEGDRFQGFHGKILVIIDEAPGVKEPIFNAIDGIAAGGDVRILLTGNPTRASGRFYDAFKSQAWNRITIDAFDSPNFEQVPGRSAEDKELWMRTLPATWEELTLLQQQILSYNPRPYLTKCRWAWEKGNDWGWDSGIFQSRVRGKFPEESDDQLFGLAALDACRLPIEAAEGEALEDEVQAGCDVAGPGENESVFYSRQGPNITRMRTTRVSDPRGFFAKQINETVGLSLVRVDAVGIGYHCWTHLKDLSRGSGRRYSVVKVVGQEKKGVDKRFLNLRSQMGWQMRDRVKNGQLGNLTDDVTIGQLLSLRYYHDSSGKIALVSKEDMVQKDKTKSNSPDRAEALILACEGPARKGMTAW